MTPRMLFAAAFCGGLAFQVAGARELTVVTRGASLAGAQDTAYIKPFGQTGEPARLLTWSGGLGTLRARVEGGPFGWDVVLVDAEELAAGCDEGLFTRLAWPALGGKDHYLPQAVSDCGVGAAVRSTVLAWDHDKFPGTPGWPEFWDVARFPGKRGLRRSARGTLEIALLADGVAPGDVYRVLHSDDGVDRAFRKLDQIKPYLVWWANPGSPAQWLGSGEVLMTSGDSAAIVAAGRESGRHFGVQFTNCLTSVLSWIVLRTTGDEAEAIRLLAFMADPARQAAFAAALPYGPTVRGANELLRPELAAVSPSAAPNVANALTVDEQFWRDNGERLTQRFDAWLAH